MGSWWEQRTLLCSLTDRVLKFSQNNIMILLYHFSPVQHCLRILLYTIFMFMVIFLLQINVWFECVLKIFGRLDIFRAREVNMRTDPNLHIVCGGCYWRGRGRGQPLIGGCGGGGRWLAPLNGNLNRGFIFSNGHNCRLCVRDGPFRSICRVEAADTRFAHLSSHHLVSRGQRLLLESLWTWWISRHKDAWNLSISTKSLR